MQFQRFPILAALLSFAALTTTAQAQTIFVTTSSDVTDFGGAKQVADLPGPDGKVSLAEAGLASDNTPGVQTIGFHVPQSEWTFQWLYPGRVVLQPFLGFRVFSTAILDATTQTAFTGNTNPSGGEVVIMASTYLINNVGGVVRGFDSTAISISGGSNNRVLGNTLVGVEVYDSPFTEVGGVQPDEGNTCGTIKIDRSNNNVVVGNTTTRVRILGGGTGSLLALNNRVGGPTPAERNYITGYGTSSEGCPGGTTVQIAYASGTLIENKWIGTTPDGLAQGSQLSTTGLGLESENYGTVIRNNRIAGILGKGTFPHCAGFLYGTGIRIDGIGSGVTIVGNKLGLNALDQPVLGSVTGIETANYFAGTVQNIVIGGTGPGEGNEIAGHLGTGIKIAGNSQGVRISGNSIHDNGGLGIDLITPGFLTGVTPNDPLDPDLGGNGLQNFPVLQAVTNNGATVRFVGTLNSSASSSFALEFFAAPQCDSSGFGKGRQFLGSTSVTTSASGNASFDVTLPAAVQSGWFASSTATLTSNGSTSEFSACVPIATGANLWANLGQGLAGASGVPLLVGTGALLPASPIQWSLSNAAGNAAGWFVVGLTQIQLPIVGGVLVPAPDALLPVLTSPAGTALLQPSIQQALPSGQTISVQVWLVDPAGVQGWAASNAIATSAP